MRGLRCERKKKRRTKFTTVSKRLKLGKNKTAKKSKSTALCVKSKESKKSVKTVGYRQQRSRKVGKKGKPVATEYTPYRNLKLVRSHRQLLRSRDVNFEETEITDLKTHKYIGACGFGKVKVVEFQNQFFALKSCKKAFIVKNDCVAEIINERKILLAARGCPFIVKLHRTYRTQRNVHFLMELCLGGDLYSYATQFRPGQMPEETVKFSLACIVEAFKFLRARNFVFRDLKEQNVIIDAFGLCKLTDFGLCEVVEPGSKLEGAVGTDVYFAPELVANSPYDHAVDLWAMGITVYSVLTGRLPFKGDNIKRSLGQQIKAGFHTKFQFPNHLSREARDVIQALCRKKPEKRLGYNSMAELEVCPWMKDFNWHGLRNKTIVSPINREFFSVNDLHYFSPSKSILKQHTVDDDEEDPPVKDLVGWDYEF